ncbi:uncharacterized protein [Aegilops tauschii subsp. strangulata]|nr:uncharacterized protein LOC109757261 isoform X2 [Aegilops tauschii subsp. strangulata]XP_020171669.1 uncharacterized protein LOC109757261 isoform X2 [Aegilops tauschii subsp. strangulata]XP_044332690.1 uncharacterized protein LOC123053295 isoform X2 [Triticum aestivum]
MVFWCGGYPTAAGGCPTQLRRPLTLCIGYNPGLASEQQTQGKRLNGKEGAESYLRGLQRAATPAGVWFCAAAGAGQEQQSAFDGMLDLLLVRVRRPPRTSTPSKGKQKENVNNVMMFHQATYDKLLSE